MATGPDEEGVEAPKVEITGSAPATMAGSFARLAGRLADQDVVVRALAAIAALIAWFTLANFTYSATRQVADLLSNQSPFQGAYPVQSSTTISSSGYAIAPSTPPFSGFPTAIMAYPPPQQQAYPAQPYYQSPSISLISPASPWFYKVIVASMAAVATIAAVPVVMLWLALLKLTGPAARIFANSALRWPIRRGSDRNYDDRQEVVAQFLGWFRALALCYVAILMVYVVGRVLQAASIVAAQPAIEAPGSQPAAQPLPSPIEPAKPPSQPSPEPSPPMPMPRASQADPPTSGPEATSPSSGPRPSDIPASGPPPPTPGPPIPPPPR